MTYVLYANACIIITFIAFVGWQITSVSRARQRDEKIAEACFHLRKSLTRKVAQWTE